MVLVRVTTHDGRWPDQDCLLTSTDWPALDHPSTVAYSTAMCGQVEAKLLRAIELGEFELIAPPRPEILQRVIAAAHNSAGLSPKAKSWLATL